LPEWFQSALRTEFYVKVGIVLMGATAGALAPPAWFLTLSTYT